MPREGQLRWERRLDERKARGERLAIQVRLVTGEGQL